MREGSTLIIKGTREQARIAKWAPANSSRKRRGRGRKKVVNARPNGLGDSKMSGGEDYPTTSLCITTAGSSLALDENLTNVWDSPDGPQSRPS